MSMLHIALPRRGCLVLGAILLLSIGCSLDPADDPFTATMCEAIACDQQNRLCIEANGGLHASCGACESGFWENEGQCQKLTVCGDNAFEVEAPTEETDRVCVQHTPSCQPGTYETKAPSEYADRECTEHSAPCKSGQYESQIASSTQDRICAPLTACTATQEAYRLLPSDGSALEDRVCCHLHTGALSVEDGIGWPYFRESCLVVHGDLTLTGEDSPSVPLRRLNGDLTIIDYTAADLRALNELESIVSDGTLVIEDNANLTSLAGLAALQNVGSLKILGNPKLQSLNGANALLQVQNSLSIRKNDALCDDAAEAFAEVVFEGTDLEIADNGDDASCP